MATTPTSIGPIGARQINHNLYVGQNDLTTIQSAVTVAAKIGGLFTVVIPFDYAGGDVVSAVTGGTASIEIIDYRNNQMQTYTWNGTQYTPQFFQQSSAFIAQGLPSGFPAGSVALAYDPTGTGGAGTAHLDFTANAGRGMPSFNFVGHPLDGTNPLTFMRLELSTPGVFPAGIPQLEAQLQLGLFNEGFDSFNLWLGGGYITGSQGMTVWAKADEDAIDFQGQTLGGAYDQTIRLNNLGGSVQIGPVIFDETGDITEIAALTAATITAGDAVFETCEVDASPVRTFANTPDGPGQGMVWPTEGVAVSQGDHWQNPSIDPASLATWPAVGIPVSTGTAWGTPIPVANVVVTNPTGDTLIDNGWNAWFIRGSAPPPIAGSPAPPPGADYTGIFGMTGQSTTGVPNGAIAGNGNFTTIGGGDGGSAPTGSTNGNGGDVYLQGGNPGSGTGTAGAYGNVNINIHHGITYIGAGKGSGFFVLAGGAFGTNFNAGFTNGLTVGTTGLTCVWNLQNGNGETDFINARGGVGGGFTWYNVASGTTMTSTTPSSMTLDSANNLTVGSAIYCASQKMKFYDRTIQPGVQAGASISTDGNQNMVINAPNSAPLYVNYDQGQHGTVFGNGASVVVATIDQLGHATFNALAVSGNKQFVIPHPLDETRDLAHACLEGPENGVYYRGEGITESGWAEITLPHYFEALVKPTDRSVLLTALFEEEAEQVGMVAASRVKDGKFKVWSALPAQKFYWEVKAVRGDIDPLDVEPPHVDPQRLRIPEPEQSEGEKTNA